ncbi:DUF445 domain-containing protein [Cohnella lupini]|uniref:Uncharacterized membrane-anchored protein YjiN (DUF445 family) n=1 Tax=Cohnella lupini TaxID=1294267 RepID=A0A3D9IWX7_9BACL|nr:DUF445 domain-containing protein [Cohnella lupini]RED66221.1 uncharacterized membrane-anchored protein YjiN (DUF445 family) [Cohnella lupini]
MNTRYIAGLSLVTMGVGFVTTLFLPENPYVELLKGGFEAGLVGGFADWFAVTALFRHPMGIPIPHTSLLLKNREKIANSLISALENELLNKESITKKLQKFQLMRVAGSALVKLAGKKRNRISVLDFSQALLARLPLEAMVPYLQSGIASIIRKTDAQALAEKAVDAAIRGSWDEKALDYALDQGRAWASKPETGYMLGSIAQQKITEAKVGGLMGFAVQAFAGFMNEEKLGTMIQQLLLSGIQDLIQPGNANRERLLAEIRNRLLSVAGDEEMLARGKEWLADKALQPQTEQFLVERLEEIRGALIEALEKEKLSGGKIVVAALRFVIRKLQAEQEMAESAERKVLSFIVDFVEANHYRLGVLLKDNLDQMNDKELVRMLEEKVGGDLQWIRVNGALCGFLIGLVLTCIQWL